MEANDGEALFFSACKLDSFAACVLMSPCDRSESVCRIHGAKNVTEQEFTQADNRESVECSKDQAGLGGGCQSMDSERLFKKYLSHSIKQLLLVWLEKYSLQKSFNGSAGYYLYFLLSSRTMINMNVD